MVNRQDDNLGKIHEQLVIDAKDDRMVYVVLSMGDFLGMVNKLFAMLWKAFGFHAAEHKLILNVDKEKLKTAPVFDKDTQWPDFSDTLWGKSIYDCTPLDFVGSTIRSACQTEQQAPVAGMSKK